MSTSNRNGRVFEYYITNALRDVFPGSTLSSRAIAQQARDSGKASELPHALSQDLQGKSARIASWAYKKLCCGDRLVAIDRLSDHDAARGDVADIHLAYGDQALRLSVKHNHKAMKHQRPSAFMRRCGYARGSPEERLYSSKYLDVLRTFHAQAAKLNHCAMRFSDLVAADKNFITNWLYTPVCSLIHDAINESVVAPKNVQALFAFLIGSSGYYKIISSAGCLRVYDLSGIELPTSLKSVWRSDAANYLILDFSNNWRLSMRLHTASKMIRQNVDLKFDTQPLHMPISYEDL